MKIPFKPHPAQKKLYESTRRFEVISKVPRRLGYGAFIRALKLLQNIT